MDYVAVQVFTNYVEAHIAAGRLKEEGISCWLKDEHTLTIDPILTNALGGIKLMVPAEQEAEARGLLHQFEAERKQNWACPRCGSGEIELVSTPRKASNWVGAIFGFLFGNYALAVDKTYHCFHCGAEFDEPVRPPEES